MVILNEFKTPSIKEQVLRFKKNFFHCFHSFFYFGILLFKAIDRLLNTSYLSAIRIKAILIDIIDTMNKQGN